MMPKGEDRRALKRIREKLFPAKPHGLMKREGYYVQRFWVYALLTVAIWPAVLNAAGTLTIAQPVSSSVSDTFKIRVTHPATGASNKPHRGMDYAAPCGTNISASGGTLTCGTMSGYGGVGEIKHDCGITERYAHLQSCSASGGKMVTGGAAGMAGAGTSTGCHLHYEIRINGTAVDPQVAYGKNLCDPDVQQQLIADAQLKLNGLAGGGGGTLKGGSGSGTGTGINDENIDTVVYVETGAKDPITGTINTGAPYYIVRTKDGRVYTEVPPAATASDIPRLPSTKTSDFTIPRAGDGLEFSGCATDTWTAMVNQSVLETRREMVVNQTLISKPDSIMAYSCFSAFNDTVRKYGGIFSESKLWVNRSIDIEGGTVLAQIELGEYSLDGALTNVVMEPYEIWMHANYNHEFLGGKIGAAATGAETEDQSYAACGAMLQVWQLAKCMNHDAVMSPFFPRFVDLITTDPRRFPATYQCNRTGITQEMIDTAGHAQVKFSPIQSYAWLLFPYASGATVGPPACAPPIRTGLTVVRNKGEEQITGEITYEDGLCITAGCSYQNTAGTGIGQCVVKN